MLNELFIDLTQIYFKTQKNSHNASVTHDQNQLH